MADRQIPLFTLQAFWAACQEKTFTRAAESIGISQSAVTRHISALENHLGTQLFERGQHGARLTTQGRTYLEAINPALEMIVSASSRLRRQASEAPVRLVVFQMFAMKWLIPRLAGLKAWAPHVNIQIESLGLPDDPQHSDLDAAIFFGDGHWENYRSELLMPDLIEPVCSPSLIGGETLSPDGLSLYPMLRARSRADDWPQWARAVGRFDVIDRPTIELPTCVMTFQAAEAGVGVALGHINFLAEELARGTLVRALNLPVSRPLGFYFLEPSAYELSRAGRIFRQWLMMVVEAERAAWASTQLARNCEGDAGDAAG